MQILKKIKNNSDYKRLFENFISLSILQGLNYILPLVTFPYLVRVLGVEKFGLLSFATATIAYFQILTDYGFNLSATREVAIYRDNKEKLQEIFGSVMIIKFGLLLVSLILLSIVVFSFNKFRQDWLVYYLSFGMVLGQVLFPVWFFQGMERMRYITILNVVAKGIFTIAIFVFVKENDDLIWVPLLSSLGYIITGIISVSLIIFKYDVNINFISIKNLTEQLKNGWYLFVSTVGTNLYRNFNIIILGFFTNTTIVGYYAISEKLLKAIQGLQIPIGQTLYPYIANKFKKQGVLKAINNIFKYSILAFIFYCIIFILTFIFAKNIIFIISGDILINAINDLKIFSIVIVFGGLNYYFGILGIVSLGYGKYFSKAVIISGFFNIIIAPFLSMFLKDSGAALSLVFSEGILLFL
ncbi:MAG: flippase, partial [Spirochaetota bacterium]